MASTLSSASTSIVSSSVDPASASSPSVMATFVVDGDYEVMQRNTVLLSPRLYKSLFPNEHPSEQRDLHVGHYIYRAVRKEGLHGNVVVINALQKMECETAGIINGRNNKIFVKAADPDAVSRQVLNRLVFEVSLYEPLTIRGDHQDPISINAIELQAIFLSKYRGQVFKSHQCLFFYHPQVGALTCKIIECKLGGEHHLSPFGRLSNETEIQFCERDFGIITFVERCPDEDVISFNFVIEAIRGISSQVLSQVAFSPSDASLWRKNITPLPLTVSLKSIADQIEELLGDKEIIPGDLVKLNVGGGGDWEYDVLLDTVSLRSHEVPQGHSGVKYQKICKYTPGQVFKVVGNKGIILTKREANALPADKMTLEVIGFVAEAKKNENIRVAVSAQEIKRYLRENKQNVAIGSKFIIMLLGNIKLLLEVTKAVGRGADEQVDFPGMKDLWFIGDETAVSINAKGLNEIKLVDSDTVYPIKKLKVMIAQDGASQFSEAKREIVKHEHLKDTFLDLALDSLSEKQEIKAVLSNGQKIVFTIQEIDLGATGKPLCEYGAIFAYNKDTDIQFDAEREGPLVISSQRTAVDYNKINETLNALGIGGFKEKFEIILRQFILPKSEYAEWNAANDQKPPHGILLAGPPGTGKTLLARKLGELLGCTKERIKIVTGARIWDKYLGNSEKNVRELFAAAREAQREFGDESPPFLIVIDECEAILARRSENEQRFYTNVTTTFLDEIDGNEPLNNVVVIGITNRPEILDEAAVRPGRLHPTIEVSLPEEEGRKEIFEIHTRKLCANGSIADDVDFNILANITVGRSGAFIEGLVNRAFSFTFARLSKDKIPAKDVFGHPLSKVTMEDFVTAFDEIVSPAKAHIKPVLPLLSADLDTRRYLATNKQIVGLRDSAIAVVDNIVLTRTLYKQQIKDSGIKLSRGLLIHGPAGAGKTALAKAFENLLHCRPDQFHYFSSSQLLKGFFESPLEKLRAIFAPAYQAAKDLKSAAPLHVVVLEDIDRFFPAEFMPDDPSTLIDLLLKEVDALFEQEEKPSNSLLVIGTLKHQGHIGDNDPLLMQKNSTMLRLGNLSKKRIKEVLMLYIKGDTSKLDMDDISVRCQNLSPGEIQQMVARATMLAIRKNESLAIEHFKAARREMVTKEDSRIYN